jgi:glycyl-tRNA synthetase alpha chain
MALLTTEALVLRGYKLGETSKVVVLLTRDRGKVRAVARGARGAKPRYQSALEPLSEVRVTLYGRQGAELLRLGEAELLHSAFRAGTRSLDAALFLSGCAELLDAFSPEGEAEDRVYRLALAVVEAAEKDASPELLGRYLEAWLLKLHGLYPPLDRCATCGGPLAATGPLSYHRGAHGFVCADCGPASGPDPAPAGRALPPPARRARRGEPGGARDRGVPPGPHHGAPRAGPPVPARDPRGRTRGSPVTLQEIVFALERFWSERGCLIHQPWDAEVGAGTMHPETFFRVLGPRPWKVGYVQPSRRPADGRYGENPNRLYKHEQFQVILKPPPADIQEQYLASLEALGIDPSVHDVRFEEDNWESPTLGAWGIGWQVLLDGQEITQFTYFQQAGGMDLAPISGEITYGLERIGMYLQDVEDVYQLRWSRDTLYRDVRHEEEFQLSRYSFELADVDLHRRTFDSALAEGWRLLEAAGGRAYLPAYDWALKSSHAFNVLDARGAISVTERAGMILKIRKLACAVAKAYVEAVAGPAGGPEAARG